MAGVGEWRRIEYEATDGTGRTPSFTLIVTRTPMPFVRGATSTVEVLGKRATLAERYLGDGVVVPILIIPLWTDAVVEIQARSSDTTVEQLIGGAKLIRPLSAAQWRTRLKELSFATRNANTDPQSTRIDLGEHRADGAIWRATVIVPSDFPLSASDRRRACLELSFGGAVVTESNCGDAWTIRLVQGTRFVFGTTGDAVDSITLRSATLPGETVAVQFERTVTTVATGKGVKVWMTTAPAQQCYFQLTRSDRWSQSDIIRPLNHPQYPDPCAITGPPRPPSSAPVGSGGPAGPPTTSGAVRVPTTGR